MAPSRNIIVAGAGIGGLTASLALAQRGFRVCVLEQADKLEEAGAGIQLSPNVTRILIDLDLEPLLRRYITEPTAIEIKTARGRRLARLPLSRAGLWRALLVDPPRRSAVGAAGRCAGQPRHRAEARHAR
jgi:salicylate hydroxylase